MAGSSVLAAGVEEKVNAAMTLSHSARRRFLN
jgi:hypothetical protein